MDFVKVRRRPPYVATTKEYLDTLLALSLSDKQCAMLGAHAAARNHRMRASEIASAADYPNFKTANVQYGRLAHAVADHLGLNPPLDQKRQKPVWTYVLAEWRNGDRTWEMHRELVEAIRRSPLPCLRAIMTAQS